MIRSAHASVLVSALVMVALVGCGDSGSRAGTDGGTVRMDSGSMPPRDGGVVPATDSGSSPGVDAGPDVDGGEACGPSATTCETCTPMGPCGWCATTSTCMVGGSTGPTTGTCADWRYVTSECMPVDCTVATDCASCTAMGPCGWCGAGGGCARGTTDGPMTGTCASGWAWLSSECPGAGVDGGAG